MATPILDLSERREMDKQKALESALAQIERSFGKGSIMQLGATPAARHRGDLDRLARARHRAGHRRPAEGADHRDLRAGKLGQDHAGAARHRRGAEDWRRLRLRRRRARARPALRQEARGRPRRAADLPARHRRAGARDHRHAGALRRGLVVVVDSVAALTPQAELEGDMGDAQVGAQARLMSQAMRKLTALDLALALHGDLHQPDPHEDRRDVRQPRDHHGRQCAEVLRLRTARHPPHRRDQGSRRGGRQHDPRQGGQEQGGAAVQAGRVRHHVRRGHLQDAAS